MFNQKEYSHKYYKEHYKPHLRIKKTPEQIRERKKYYYQVHKEYYQQYRDTHKKHQSEYQKHRKPRKEYNHRYYLNHKEQFLAQSKDSYRKHKTHRIEYNKKYTQIHKEQINESYRKHSAKRRNLGFIPLNASFVGSEPHHIDKILVIYIPKELHVSIPHNVWTGRGMAEINDLALEYLNTLVLGKGL